MKTAEQTLETHEFGSFYKPYLMQIPFEPLEFLFETEMHKQLEELSEVSEQRLDYRYAPEKWSIAEVIMHVIDTERVFAYRALRFVRNDKTDLPGYDQDEWMKDLNLSGYSKLDLMDQFTTCRNHSKALFKGFHTSDLLKTGRASQNLFSVRALGYIILGHHAHHFNVLKSHYLS